MLPSKLIHSPAALLALLCAALTHCASDDPGTLPPAKPPRPAAQAAPTVSVFQVGDTLELFVKEDSTLNGSYLVREGGYIVIPRAGRIAVAGLTRDAAEPLVRDVLQRTQLKEANVIVERTPATVAQSGAGAMAPGMPRILVFITGNVPRSGGHTIPVPEGKTVGVYEALLITGGFSKFAMIEKVEVFRHDASGKRRRAVVDLRPVMRGEAEDPPIAEGDIIHVPAKVFGF